MTTKLKWRLSKLPTVEELLKLVNDKVITQEEAKEILFNQETESERDTNSLKEEIKFLRETIEHLSKNNRSQLIETIRYVEKPYYHWNWYQPYVQYYSGSAGTVTSGASLGAWNTVDGTTANSLSSVSNLLQAVNTMTSASSDFTAINTF